MPEYSHREHWNRIRRGRLVQVISFAGSAIAAAAAVRDLITGESVKAADILKFLPGSPWAWISLTLLALLVVLFHETRHIVKDALDGHDKTVRDLTVAHERQLAGEQSSRDEILKAERALSESRQREHDLQLSVERDKVKGLEARVHDLDVKLGQPRLTMSFAEVNYMHEFDEPGVPYDEHTEFVVENGSSIDAFKVYLAPAQIGDYTIQSQMTIEKLPANQSKKIEYVVLYDKDPVHGRSINLSYRGHLKDLLETLTKDGREPVRFPLSLRYRDFHGTEYETPMDLFWLLGYTELPVLEIKIPRRLEPKSKSQGAVSPE